MKTFDKIKKPLIFIVLACLVVGYYIYLTHRNVDNNESIADNSSRYSVLDRDLERNYPGTPRSVVTYYSDILKVIYKEELTDDEFESTVEHLRGLFDNELLAYNDYETYYLSLKNEIESYQDSGMYVADYSVEDGYDIEYKTLEDGENYAYVDVSYYVRSGKTVTTIYELFTLRKDDDGNWRMLTWASVENPSN